MHTKKETNSIQGISFDSLAKSFGTPLYIYDAGKIASQINVLRTAFENINIKYAAKALTNVSILHFMKQQGVGVDVVSIQEAQIAFRAGFAPGDIMFTPNCVGFERTSENSPAAQLRAV